MVVHYKSLVFGDERILLYLLEFPMNKSGLELVAEAPRFLTTQEIANAVIIERHHMSKYIKKLEKQEYIDGILTRVKGKKRKQMVYFLTDVGRAKAEELKEQLMEEELTVLTQANETLKLKFHDVSKYLKEHDKFREITDLEICKYTNIKGILDTNILFNTGQHYIDFTEDVSKPEEFYGREQELSKLNAWITDKELYRVIIIYGIAGIGKTTLTSKLIDTYRGSKHLFWHNFYNWDTVRGVLLRLSEFLSKIGDDKLIKYIDFDRPLKLDKILKSLKDEMEELNLLLIFDDVHKANEELRSFISSLIEILNQSNTAKFLILSRYIIPFYNQRKVLVRKSIAELELEGLDFQSSVKILRKKGLPQAKYRAIYNMTAGNPLLLEIFEHNRKSKRYIYEEIFTQLTPDEQKIMEILSTGRAPIPYNAFFINKNILPGTIGLLVQNFVIKETSYGAYDAHEFIKEFFYKRLPPSTKTQYHEHFAKYYRNKKSLRNYLEAIHHYIKSLQYPTAIELAMAQSPKMIDQGLSENFLVVLEELPEQEVPLPQWTDILILKAQLCFTIGDWDKSLQYYQRTIEIGTEVGREDIVAKAYYEIGGILEERALYEDALKNFEKSYELSKKLKAKKLIRDSKRGIVRVRMINRNSKLK